VRPAHVKPVMAKLRRLGEKPAIIGEIVKGSGEVRIIGLD
jgi:uncharacterized Zn-binding protein involved in type VI secretion